MSGIASADNIGDGTVGQPSTAPAHFAFDAKSEAQIPALLAKYPPERQASAVLALLWLAQYQMERDTGSAWLPRPAMDVVAARLGMPPIRVYEIATFYSMFNTQPVGRYHLQVCTTTPCWLRGSDEVVAACRRVTGLKGWHETTKDGLFTISEVECLGACVNAPILAINDDFYEDLDSPRTEALLRALQRGEPLPPPGTTIDRQTSAPVGGANTLTTIDH